MNVIIDISTVLNGVILLLIGLGVRGLFKMRDDMNKHFAILNGRVIRLEEEFKHHEVLDNERVVNSRKEYEALWGRINEYIRRYQA